MLTATAPIPSRDSKNAVADSKDAVADSKNADDDSQNADDDSPDTLARQQKCRR
jgi:hypothetical protein